jgi:hypothetical protein
MTTAHSTNPRRKRRALPASALACVLLAVAVPAASGGVALRTSVAPATVSFPADIVYGLEMVNDGDVEERFSVALIAPTYHPSRPGDAVRESNAIRQLGTPVIEGPASVLGGYTHLAGMLPSCSVAGAGGHGYGLDDVSFDVGLPPRTTSTLRATYRAGLPFWPDLDLRLRFVLDTTLTTGKPGTLSAPRKILSPQPAITGPVAVHLTFVTTPASGLTSFDGRRPIALGKSIVISGRALPAVAGAPVQLRYARIGRRSNVLERGRAARLRVGSDGAFEGSWTPRRSGSYELWARYERGGPSILADDTCPRLLRVRSR